MSLQVPESAEGKVLLGCSVLLASCYVARNVHYYWKRRAIDRVRALYQTKCKENIATVSRVVKQDQEVNKTIALIAKMTSPEIVKAIKGGQLSARQVLRAYQAKALDAHEKTNCISWFLPEAEELALAADKCQKKEGLLFGLPISVKDHYYLKVGYDLMDGNMERSQGHDTTNGLVSNLMKPSECDCLMVEVLRSHGAIPFVRTNIPQTMISFACCNPIFGYTKNPHDVTRGPGGSTGGEGAILGARGSPLGLGSDLGGSIRMPSGWCGIFGFKPCSSRMSHIGMEWFRADQNLIYPSYGPMSGDMDSVILALEAFWDGQMIKADQLLPPLTFNYKEFESKKPLKIGYYYDLPCLAAVPAMKRAVQLSIDALKAAGHELIPYCPPELDKAHELLFSAFFASGGNPWHECLEYDRLDDNSTLTMQEFVAPSWLKKIRAVFAKCFKGNLEARIARSLLGIKLALNYMEEGTNLSEYRRLHQESWDQLGLDAVIGPTFPFPAMPIKMDVRMNPGNLSRGFFGTALLYTGLYNLLDLPAGSVPVTTVNNRDLEDMFLCSGSKEYLRCLNEGMKGAEGLPIGVQVVAPRFRDERALRVMRELDRSLVQK